MCTAIERKNVSTKRVACSRCGAKRSPRNLASNGLCHWRVADCQRDAQQETYQAIRAKELQAEAEEKALRIVLSQVVKDADTWTRECTRLADAMAKHPMIAKEDADHIEKVILGHLDPAEFEAYPARIEELECVLRCLIKAVEETPLPSARLDRWRIEDAVREAKGITG